MSISIEKFGDGEILRDVKNPIGLVREIENPFYQVIKRLHGDNWRVCMWASIILSKTVSRITGIPIGQKLLGEHLELDIGIYDPISDPNHKGQMEEHVYIKYYDGKGSIYYVDPIYKLLMNHEELKEGDNIIIDKLSEDEFDETIKNKYHIQKFDRDYPNIRNIRVFNVEKEYEVEGMYIKLLGFLNNGNGPIGRNADRFGLMVDRERQYAYDTWIDMLVKLYEAGQIYEYDLEEIDWYDLLKVADPDTYHRMVTGDDS